MKLWQHLSFKKRKPHWGA